MLLELVLIARVALREVTSCHIAQILRIPACLAFVRRLDLAEPDPPARL